MTINHHAGDATLMSFAAGALPEAFSAVVAAHVAICNRCRKEVAALETLGGIMLADVSPAALSNRVPMMAEPKARSTGSGYSSPLARLIGGDLASVRWRRLGYGMWHVPLQLSPGSKGDLRLIKIAPGQVMPEHGHGGSELSLILEGSYTDAMGRFGVGDLADLDEEVEHKPAADRKSGCVCLIAVEQKARLKGLFARMVQPFVGI